ncbi:hypothetical protein GGR57DRAFT_520967 [Xylariaceae sp. FL1272]|nr:hypothetical protein GGR57DRAFT_520967 [Xylariaceae sp. FL1272]
MLDRVVEAEVVLANGSVVGCSKTEQPDLFFALRAAAASFGIVTRLALAALAAPPSIVNYSYAWVGENSSFRADIFRSWQQISGVLDQEIEATGIGDPSYIYAKSAFFDDETRILNGTVYSIMAHLDAAANGTRLWAVNLEMSGGYVASVPVSSTAMPHRQAEYAMLSYAQTSTSVLDTDFRFLDDLSSIAKSDHRNAFHGQYPGYVDPREDNDEARRPYWAGSLERLHCIKARLDPHNVFHNQQSVLTIC